MNKLAAISAFILSLTSRWLPLQAQHGDCAKPINLSLNYEYIHENSPQGPGNEQEFQGNQGRIYLFPAEINTVWYRFTAIAEGEIVFELSPFRAEDDYDWMLFKAPGPGSCDAIRNYRLLPLRGNRARNDLRIGGATGLRENAQNLHAPPGPGNSYSRALPVKEGESYLLVVDNIYPGGSGHRIRVHYVGQEALQPVKIRVKVVDKASGKALGAHLYAMENSSMRTLLSSANRSRAEVIEGKTAGRNTKSDTLTESISLQVLPGTSMQLAAVKKGYLLGSLNLKAGQADTTVLIEIEPAVKGGKMVLFNIGFIPNKAEFRENALPELRRLLAFMQASDNKYIRITGHTNANVFSSKSWLLDLSVYRAAAVRDFLIQHGVDPQRIRIAGAGGSRPLTRSNDRTEAMKNLRVEIELLN